MTDLDHEAEMTTADTIAYAGTRKLGRDGDLFTISWTVDGVLHVEKYLTLREAMNAL